MSLFERLGNAAGALVNEAEKIGTAVVKTAREAIGWAGNVLQGNVGTQPVAIPEVVFEMLNGNSSSWDRGGDTAYLASNAHSNVAAKLSAMLNNLEPAWTGKASEGARERTRIFTKAIDSAGESFDHNGTNVSDAANGFNQARAAMEPMGARPDKSLLDVAAPWDTDTEQAIERYNRRAEANKNIYDRYAAHLNGQGAGLRTDYGEISPEFGQPSTVASGSAGGSGSRGASGKVAQTRSGGHPATPMVGGAPAPGSVSGSDPASGPGPVNVPAAGGHLGDDRTTATGYQPFDPRAGLPLLDVPLPGVPGQSGNGPVTGGVNPVGGPGGSGPVGGLGNLGGTAGGGRQTGARGLGEEPGRGGAGTGRGTGSRPASGLAGMAPAVSRGKPEQETEHKRRYLQDESGLFSEEDRDQVDPTTGLPPAPPTIGL